MRVFKSVATISGNRSFEDIIGTLAGYYSMRKAMRNWFQTPSYPAVIKGNTYTFRILKARDYHALRIISAENNESEDLIIKDNTCVIEVHSKTPGWLPLDVPKLLTCLLDSGIATRKDEYFSSYTPVAIDSDNLENFIPVLKGEKELPTPVVFLTASKSFRKPVVDPDVLQEKLMGQAHVVYEADAKVSNKIRNLLMDKDGVCHNPYGGTAEIILSSFHRFRFHFQDYAEPEKAIPAMMNQFHQRVAKDTRWKQYMFSTIMYLAEKEKNNVLQNQNSELSDEIESLRARVKDKDDEELEAIFDDLTTRLDNERALRLKAENRLAALEERLKDTGVRHVSLSLPCDELYPGELRDAVLRIIERSRDSLFPSGRLSEVAGLVLENNRISDTGNAFEEEVRVLFSDPELSEKTQQRLGALGFTFEWCGNCHHVIYAPIPKYSWTIAATPSDKRSGLNASANAVRDLFR